MDVIPQRFALYIQSNMDVFTDKQISFCLSGIYKPAASIHLVYLCTVLPNLLNSQAQRKSGPVGEDSNIWTLLPSQKKIRWEAISNLSTIDLFVSKTDNVSHLSVHLTFSSNYRATSRFLMLYTPVTQFHFSQSCL